MRSRDDEAENDQQYQMARTRAEAVNLCTLNFISLIPKNFVKVMKF